MNQKLQNIPAEMRSTNQWVVCKANTKIPYQINGQPASSTDPATWCSFDDAVKAMGWTFTNIGFVLTASDPYVIIDYDEQCPPEVIETFDTYTENSRSGRGVHIIMRAKFEGQKRKGKVECYQDNRYMIMTGDVVLDKEIGERQSQLDQWRTEHGLDVVEEAVNQSKVTKTISIEDVGNAFDVLERMQRAGNTEEVLSLYYNGYPNGCDMSSEDARLMEALRFYAGGHRELVMEIMWSSACRRDKWDRKDYLDRTWARIGNGPVWEGCEWVDERFIPGDDFCKPIQPEPVGESKPSQKADGVPDNIWVDDGMTELRIDQYYPQNMGMLSDISRYYVETAPMPIHEFAMHTALACLSVYFGRRFATVSGNYSALYYACIAPSGAGKGHGYKTIRKVLKSLHPALDTILEGSGYTSDSAIFATLQDAPSHLTYIDELGDYISGSRGSNQTQSSQWRILKEAWGNNDVICPRRYSDHTVNRKSKAMMKCEVPQITILGCATIEQFWDSLGPKDSADGFLNRWLINTVDQEPDVADDIVYTQKIDIPESMRKWHDIISKRSPITMTFGDDEENSVSCVGGQASVEPDPVMIAWDTGVSERFRAYHRDLIKKNYKKGGLDFEMYQRSAQMAMSISMMVELSKNPWAEFVTMESAEWAIDYVDTVIGQMIKYAKRNLSGSDEESLAQRFLKECRKKGAEGLTLSEFYKKKPSGGERKKINDAIQRLYDMEPPVVKVVENFKREKGRRGVRAWFAVSES